jgi:hypothetical protein
MKQLSKEDSKLEKKKAKDSKTAKPASDEASLDQ